MNLLDEMGSWIQYLRQVKQSESSNTYIFKKGKLYLFVSLQGGEGIIWVGF